MDIASSLFWMSRYLCNHERTARAANSGKRISSQSQLSVVVAGTALPSAVGPKASALGDYLRARREQVRPEEVGLAAGARRRVPGLRREELATLGISSPTTYDSSRAVTPVHPHKLWTRWRTLCGSTSKRRNICTGWPVRRAAAGRSPARETVANGLDELIDQFPMPAIVGTSRRGRKKRKPRNVMCWPRIPAP